MSGDIWAVNSQGGYLTNNSLSKSLREQALPQYVYRQFCNIKEDPGAKNGDTVFFDKVLKISTKGGTLIETNTIPESPWKVNKDSVVVTEWGNSVPYTQKLETLASFDPSNISMMALKKDQLEVIDSAAYVQFALADWVCVATSTASTVFTTNGTATITASANPSDSTVRDIIDSMETNWVPKFADGNYRSILSIQARRGIYNFLQPIAQYADPQYRHNNEVGQYYSCRFTVDNSGNASNSIGSGSQYGQAFFFGQEAVLEAIALSEELRMKIPTDFGRSKGVAWYAIMQFRKMWTLANDNLNSQPKGISRIWELTSA